MSDAGLVSRPKVGAAYIDIDEWRDAPRPHRYVHGGFEGTHTRFPFGEDAEVTVEVTRACRVGAHRDGRAGRTPFARNNARVRVVVTAR